MVATAPGEKLLIGRRPLRNWTQLQFFLFHCENQQKLLPPELHLLTPNMHQIVSRMGLRPRPLLGEHTALPESPTVVWGEAPADKRFGAYWSQKVQLWWQQFLLHFPKNKCR